MGLPWQRLPEMSVIARISGAARSGHQPSLALTGVSPMLRCRKPRLRVLQVSMLPIGPRKTKNGGQFSLKKCCR